MEEGGLRRIRAELIQSCANATNFRPAAVAPAIVDAKPLFGGT